MAGKIYIEGDLITLQNILEHLSHDKTGESSLKLLRRVRITEGRK